MKIAFLGWGSLVWDPRELKTIGSWKKDGPDLPIEFARVSRDRRLTLVICGGAREVKTLWVRACCNKLEEAIRNLACREDTDSRNIGFVSIPDNKRKALMKDLVPKIEAWAKEKKLDAVVWTDLEPNFKDKQKIELTPESATAYLRKLDDKSRKKAEIYVRNTPLQIDTKIRETLERELGWACADDDVRIQRWSDLKKSMIKRLVKESPDGSYWIVVPQEPATFGHLLAVSWKSSGEHDITDEGLFTDNSHIQNMMRAIHELTLRMKSSLTSNGKADGRKCEKVYVATLCETKDFPFHFHVIPRFEGDKEGFAYLLEKELEEARWMDRETGRNEKVKDGYRRIGSTEVLLDYHKCLMSSDKWVRTNKERDGFVSETLQWARKHTGGLSSYRIKEPRALPVDNRKED